MIAIRSRRGFTLIEMLVVIAIIGILSSLFLVGFQGYRNSANDAKKISDVHKAQLALEQAYNQNGTYVGASLPTGVDPAVQLLNVSASDYLLCAVLSGKNNAANNGVSGTCGSVACGSGASGAAFCLAASQGN
ncbi:MAG: type II secretion system protein [Candidatus Paceibacterota bacterium]|jgi:prepilin-type N-terminal cleavage/methylation domain-containing protein